MLKTYFREATQHPAPLAVFRILFGLLMLYALLRFWANNWIETLYINPKFHFKYFGFSWVSDLGVFNYLIYIICIISCIGINLLREGLDIPECALVGILDADKEGFLRSEKIGRASCRERV